MLHVTWDKTDNSMSLPVQDYHLLRSSFPTGSSSVIEVIEYIAVPRSFSHNPAQTTAASLTFMRFRLIPVRSPLLGKSFFTFFSSRYLDVSVHAVPSFVLSLQLSGLLHWEISGSMFDCN